MARYVQEHKDTKHTHAVISISAEPKLAKALWELITKIGINPVMVDGELTGVVPSYMTNENFSEDRRNPGFVGVRFANLMYQKDKKDQEKDKKDQDQ